MLLRLHTGCLQSRGDISEVGAQLLRQPAGELQIGSGHSVLVAQSCRRDLLILIQISCVDLMGKHGTQCQQPSTSRLDIAVYHLRFVWFGLQNLTQKR